jgi:acyl-coenzyme A thioesterase PaaI-like protein
MGLSKQIYRHLADMAAACAGATMLPDGWAASTIDYTLKLLAPAAGEKLVARGRILRSDRTLEREYPIFPRNGLACCVF